MSETSTPPPPSTATAPSASESPSARGSVFSRLYSGTGAFDVIGNRRRFFLLTAVLMLICVGSLVFRGFELGIDFEGGTRLELPSATASTEQVEDVFTDAIGSAPEAVQTVGSGDSASIQIRSEALEQGEIDSVRQALFEAFQPVGTDGSPDVNAISDAAVSETWGGEITQQAIIALIVFLVLVTVFLALRFERDMALAALVTLVYDVVFTAGVYSIIGLEVTPGTVIGLLTILGFSLYDTVVVFDKVEENTRGILSLTRRTYAEQTNLAVNQTFMRSINTTVIATLPVLGLLVIGVGLLGVGTLADLATVQLIGLLSGTFSSIFLAAPVLVQLKERSGEVSVHTRKVHARRAVLAERDAGAEPAEGPSTAATAQGSTAVLTRPAPVTTATEPTGPPTPRRAPRPGARPTGKRPRR